MEEFGSILAGLENFLRDREDNALRIADGDFTKEVQIASEKDTFGKAFKARSVGIDFGEGRIARYVDKAYVQSDKMNMIKEL